jgi:hypothetical protein
MAVDAVVSRELKSLQEELSASQRERLATPAALNARSTPQAHKTEFSGNAVIVAA